MSLEQANRYYQLAAKARQNGRNAIADALLRQAEREKEKAAMDVADVANIQREREAMAQNVPQSQPQAPVVETPATDVPVVEAEQPAATVPWSEKPGQPTPPVPPAKPAPYKPTAEELANMEDSGMYNSTIPQGNGVVSNPNAILAGDTGDSFNADISDKNYDVSTYGGAPSEGDMYWNTPAEIRANNERKKRKRFLDLMDAANRANL